MAGMAERFLSALRPYNMNDNILYHALARPRAPRPEPPLSLVSSASFGSARSRPGREAAKRTLDGEDQSDIIQREGKRGGNCGQGVHNRTVAQRNGCARRGAPHPLAFFGYLPHVAQQIPCRPRQSTLPVVAHFDDEESPGVPVPRDERIQQGPRGAIQAGRL